MRIGTVPVSATYTALAADGHDREIKILTEQKKRIEEELRKVQENEKNNTLKEEKAKALEMQLEDISAQIAQKQAEKFKKQNNPTEQNKLIEESNENNKIQADGSTNSSLDHLISSKATYSNIKMVGKMKNNLESDNKILSYEIRVDEARSLSGAKAKMKREMREENEKRIREMEKEMPELQKKAQEEIEKARKDDMGKKIQDEKEEELLALNRSEKDFESKSDYRNPMKEKEEQQKEQAGQMNIDIRI
ncbi:MAG: FlxA-like family protein [Clostridia bacterium]|nr:FlxA-like family protein [Clostridia bacterium]